MHEDGGSDRTWDLSPIYADQEAWERDRAQFSADIQTLRSLRGQVGASARSLLEALEGAFRLERLGNRLHTYAALLADADLRDASAQAMRQTIDALYADFAAKSAFLDPELLEIPTERIRAFLAEEPKLEPYRRYLERLEKRRSHTLTAAEEEILGQSRLVRGSGETISSLLRNTEIPWPSIEGEDGREVRLDATGYNRVRISPRRALRLAGFRAFHGCLRSFRATLATTLHATIKEHVFEARVRRFPGTLEAALHSNEVEPAVYHLLVAGVNEALPTLQRYLRLRARLLGVGDLAYHDIYAPLVPEPAGQYGWTQSRALLLDALRPLGDEYCDRLERALSSRWVDVDPRPGKRSGAYVNDGAYDAHPYMLLNHQDDYHSASTLAHEAGHLMHSWSSQIEQPYPTSRYVIFVAEVASTFNEILLLHHMLDRAESDSRRLALLGHHLDNIRGTVFRQTMFAEFEVEIHRRAERGEALTADALDELFLGLLRRYHGAESGVMEIDALYASEWAFVPHFHYNFYVYQYATSFVAALALAERVLQGDADAKRRYLRFLGSGSSKPPVDLLRDAGVDMTTGEPLRATIREMESVIDAMEEIEGRRG